MVKVLKRDGSKEDFNRNKILNAVYKSTINSKYGSDKNLAQKIAIKIEEIIGVVHNRKSRHLLEIFGVEFHFCYSLGVVVLKSACNKSLSVPGGYGVSAVKS